MRRFDTNEVFLLNYYGYPKVQTTDVETECFNLTVFLCLIVLQIIFPFNIMISVGLTSNRAYCSFILFLRE